MLFLNCATHMRLCISLLFSFSIFSCQLETKDSIEVETNHLFITLELNENNNENTTAITATAHRKSPEGSPIKLGTNEFFSVQYQGASTALSESVTDTGILYLAKVITSNNEKHFTLTFHRSTGDKVEMEITMPEGFSLVSPITGDEYYENSDTYLSWYPALPNAKMNVVSKLSCETGSNNRLTQTIMATDNIVLSDTGNELLTMSKLAGQVRSSLSQGKLKLEDYLPCNFEITASRVNVLDTSEIFAKGSMVKATKSSSVSDMFFYVAPTQSENTPNE